MPIEGRSQAIPVSSSWITALRNKDKECCWPVRS